MFDKDRFIEECIAAQADDQQAVREVVTAAVTGSSAVMAALGEPQHAGIAPLHRSSELTILNFAWAPCMSLMPHNHQMYAVTGIREDNIYGGDFFEPDEPRSERDHETLQEQPWDIDRVKTLIAQAEARFNAVDH